MHSRVIGNSFVSSANYIGSNPIFARFQFYTDVKKIKTSMKSSMLSYNDNVPKKAKFS